MCFYLKFLLLIKLVFSTFSIRWAPASCQVMGKMYTSQVRHTLCPWQGWTLSRVTGLLQIFFKALIPIIRSAMKWKYRVLGNLATASPNVVWWSVWECELAQQRGRWDQGKACEVLGKKMSLRLSRTWRQATVAGRWLKARRRGSRMKVVRLCGDL